MDQKQGASHYYYHYDSVGSVVNVTSASGATEWTESYEPFGASHSEIENDPAAPENLFRFSSEYLDSDGLYYLRARQTDPLTGRLLSVDPNAEPGGAAVSTYLYANDQPTVMDDPTGQTFASVDDGTASANLASARTLQALRPCNVGLVYLVCNVGVDTDDVIPPAGADLPSIGRVIGTGAIAAIAAAVLSQCISAYDEHRCTSFKLKSEHHIVAKAALRAKPARDILQDTPEAGVDLPGGVNNEHNLVDLPRYAHYFLHNFAYYDAVNTLIERAFSNNKGGQLASQSRVTKTLDSIGRALRFTFGGQVTA